MSKITTIKEIPTSIEKFFDKFIKTFAKKTVVFEGNELEIVEIGPREDYSSVFQCLPATSSNTSFDIAFMKSESGIDVYYKSTFESNMPDMTEMAPTLPFGGKMMGGMMKKRMEQANDMMKQASGRINQPLDNQMITLVKSSIQKTLMKLKEKKDDDKEKKHKDEEKKHDNKGKKHDDKEKKHDDKEKKHDDKDKKHKEKDKKPINPLAVLKLKLAEGAISEEEYLRKKKLLME